MLGKNLVLNFRNVKNASTSVCVTTVRNQTTLNVKIILILQHQNSYVCINLLKKFEQNFTSIQVSQESLNSTNFFKHHVKKILML